MKTVKNNIMIRKTVSVGTKISRPAFTPTYKYKNASPIPMSIFKD